MLTVLNQSVFEKLTELVLMQFQEQGQSNFVRILVRVFKVN